MIRNIFAHKKNPLVPVLLILFIFTAISGSILYSVFTTTGNLGEPLTPLTTKKAYTFSGIETTIFNHLEMSWDDPTIVFPVYNNDEILQGIALIGKGQLNSAVPAAKYQNHYLLQSAFIPMDQTTWDFIFLNGEKQEITPDPMTKEMAKDLFRKRSFLYLSVTLFGYERIFTPDFTEGHYLLGHTNDGSWIRYRESEIVELQEEYKPPFIFHSQANTTKPIFTGITLPQFFVLFGFAGLAVLLTYILTIQFSRPRDLRYYRDFVYHPGAGYILACFSLFLIFQYLLNDQFLEYGYTITIGLLMLALLPYLMQSGGYRYLGLGYYHLITGSGIAVVLALIFQSIGSLNLPRGIDWHTGRNIWWFIWTYPLLSFLHETYWRGLLQNVLIRWIGVFQGILLQVFLYSLFTFSQLLLWHSATGDSLLLQAFLLAPAEAAILGYFYWKTHNLWATAFLHMLIMLLPQSLIF